jgi:hypothetical protein
MLMISGLGLVPGMAYAKVKLKARGSSSYLAATFYYFLFYNP